MRASKIALWVAVVPLAFTVFGAGTLQAQLIPGTGQRAAFDDFEAEDWSFTHNFPKGSKEEDQQRRFPAGESKNSLWYEGPKRGQPDIVKRVPTPPGGLSGSKHSMLMRTLHTGIPGRPSYHSKQDDLIFGLNHAIGGFIPTGWSPSTVVRVYFPPFEEWENSTDTTLGLRISVSGWGWDREKKRRGLFGSRRPKKKYETYWPGIFVQFNSETDANVEKDSALLVVRGGSQGQDFGVKEITQTGWWTLGMSVTPDGQVHYYASPGVDNLTAADHLTSQFPYGIKAEKFNSFFFDVISPDDGKTWSTPWVVDDTAVYWNRRVQTATRPR
jgi:hypothetical protein